MTADAEPTLWSLFFGDHGKSESRTDRILADTRMSGVRKQLHGMPVGLMAGFHSSIDDGLQRALSVPLHEIAARGWATYRDLRKYQDPARYPPEEAVVVPLAKHTISSSHKPRVEFRLDDKLVATLEIEVELALNFDVVTLTIQAAHIREARPGTCTATGAVKCGSALLANCESKPVKLPGVIRISTTGPQPQH